MPRVCTICPHPRRAEIDQALVTGNAPLRDIARQYRVSKDSLARHRGHIPKALVKAHQAAEIAQADSLLGDVQEAKDRSERLYTSAELILNRALASQDLRTALQAIRSAVDVMGEARAYLELQGKLTGEFARAEKGPPVHAVIIMPPQVPPGTPIPPGALLPQHPLLPSGDEGPEPQVTPAGP